MAHVLVLLDLHVKIPSLAIVALLADGVDQIPHIVELDVNYSMELVERRGHLRLQPAMVHCLYLQMLHVEDLQDILVKVLHGEIVAQPVGGVAPHPLTVEMVVKAHLEHVQTLEHHQPKLLLQLELLLEHQLAHQLQGLLVHRPLRLLALHHRVEV
jgi:hypothetical protein